MFEAPDDRPGETPNRRANRATPRRAIDADHRIRDGDRRDRGRGHPVDPLSTRSASASRTPRSGRGERPPNDEAAAITALLFDAKGRDKEIDVAPGIRKGLGADQLLWVDLDGRDRRLLDRLGQALELADAVTADLDHEAERARLHRFSEVVLLTLVTVAPDHGRLQQRSLDILAGESLIVTIHDGPSTEVGETREDLADESRVGALDAAAMLGVIVDACLTAYLREVEEIERTIDRLDERALRSRGRADSVLDELVRLRHRLGLLRRALAPHREAFAPLARPDFELHEELGHPWPGLLDRLERAMGAIESVRTFLVGSFDIYMGRSAQHTNDVMKVLTLLSAILLPAVVLAGVFGMNFQLQIFDDPANVWLIVGAMITLAVGILGAARWRGWL